MNRQKNSLLCDVENSIADVVSRCLAISVDEAAAPAVLCRDREKDKTVKTASFRHLPTAAAESLSWKVCIMSATDMEFDPQKSE